MLLNFLRGLETSPMRIVHNERVLRGILILDRPLIISGQLVSGEPRSRAVLADERRGRIPLSGERRIEIEREDEDGYQLYSSDALH